MQEHLAHRSDHFVEIQVVVHEDAAGDEGVDHPEQSAGDEVGIVPASMDPLLQQSDLQAA